MAPKVGIHECQKDRCHRLLRCSEFELLHKVGIYEWQKEVRRTQSNNTHGWETDRIYIYVSGDTC